MNTMSSNLTIMPSYQKVPSVQDFNAYARYVFNLPQLEAEQERALLEDLHIRKNLEAAKTLILSQLRTVVQIARQYRNYGIPEEDLVQEGNIGLMKAVKSYDINQTVRLYTYALLWIKAEMQSYILKNWKIVKIATTNNLKKLFFNLRKVQQEMIGLGMDKRDAEKYIAEKLEVPQEDVREMTSYFLSQDSPISSGEMDNDKEDEKYDVQLIEYSTPASIYYEKNMEETASSTIQVALEQLTEKQKAVISRRFLLEDKMTHKEISQELGISSERVRQIENEALAKLKKTLVIDM